MLSISTSRNRPNGRMSVLGSALAVAAVSLLSLPQVSAAQPSQAPGQTLPGRYIVVLEEGAAANEAGPKKGKGGGPAAVAKAYGVAPDFVYDSALRGFAGPASAQQAKALAKDPRVASVEPDRLVRALAQDLPTGVDRIDADANSTAAIGEDGGEVPVTVAVIDTGIDLDHPDLNVAGGLGMTCANGKKTPDDQNGHGSHVAGSIAALDDEAGVVGVAPGAPVVPVRVLGPNGSGSLSCIVAGIDHVTANAAQIAVANMSLGWQGNSKAARDAIQGSVGAGVVYTVAAGNEDDDVYGPDGKFASGDEYEPASYPEAAAISALADSDGGAGGSGPDTGWGPDDSFAAFSNFSGAVVGGNPVESPGKAVDLLLPGVDIVSTYKDGAYATISGTSMASPHAAGLAALHIAANERAGDAAGVASIRQALIDAGRDQASGQRLAHPETEPDSFPEPLGWAGSATVNAAPAALATAASTAEDESVSVTLTGTDAETCELGFSIAGGPDNGSLGAIGDQACAEGEPNSDTATVTYTPNADFNGEDSFVFKVTDGDGASDEATVSIAVSALNDAPSAGAVTVSTPEDTETAWTPVVSDPDSGDVLTCSIPAEGGPSDGSATVASDCSGGTYAPDPNFNGEDSFTYRVSDGTAADTATVTVTVEAVNDAPVAAAVAAGTAEDSSVLVTLEGSDVEACELGFSIASAPSNGGLGAIGDEACTSAGDTASVTYTPNADFNGEDTFTYTVSDGVASDTATVTVTVSAVNDAPVAVGDSDTTDIGTSTTVNVLANDGDVDGDALSIDRYDATSVEGGSVSCETATGKCAYTPAEGFSGEDSFTYEATDGELVSNTATVTISVVSSPPTADASSVGTDEDSAVTITLSGSDQQTCELGFSIASGPANGSLGETGDQTCAAGEPNSDTATVTYTPNTDFNGEDSFVFKVTDDDGASDEATVSITVSALNDAPTAGAISVSTAEDTEASWTPNVSDPDSGDLLTCSIPAEGGPSNGSATVASDCSGGTYAPDPNFNGEDSFTYRVSDGTAADTATVSVTVEAVNDAPVAVGDEYATQEGETLSVATPGVVGNDSDVDGDALSAAVASGPADGSLTLNADGSLTYTPDAGFSGEDSFTYSASDGALSDTATVAITVEAAPSVGGFLEDFEGGVSGWTASGLWHLADDTGCVSPGYTSATRSAYFGDESSCTYRDRRKQVLGSLTSPSIAVGAEATLTFSSWREVELYSGGAFDRTWVEVSYDGGSSWTTVWYHDSTDPSAAEWKTESVGLSPPEGAESAVVRFRFDTVDGVANDYRGWLIDDVAVD